jgi:hypothetical protein
VGVKVVAADSIAPAVAGEKAFTWEGKEVSLDVPVPFACLYQIEYAFLRTGTYDEPALFLAGHRLSSATPSSGSGGVGSRCIHPPLAVRQGKCRVTVSKEKGDCALLYLAMQPIYRDLAAEDFRVIGPFAGAANLRSLDDIRRKMDERLPPEEQIDFSALYPGDHGRMLRWTTPLTGINVADATATHFIDFYRTFGVLSEVVGYAVTRIESPEDRAAEIRFGADYWAKVWLNGEVILRPDQRPATPPRKGEHSLAVRLRKAANTVVIKVHAGSAGNGFWCAISDPGDLRIHPV